MINLKRIFIALIFLCMLSQAFIKRDCPAYVVNSIVARVNDHIITFRDLEIEYSIRSRIDKKYLKSKREVIEDMIDDYLFLCEQKRIPQKGIRQELEEQVENDINEFEALFNDNEYDDFLSGLEITRDDIYLRFKNRALIDNYLKRKLQVKKNGSILKENMILKNDEVGFLPEDLKEHAVKLRKNTYRIMVNDIVEEGSIQKIY